MKPALKWGIAGAAGIAIALAIKNISDENEETAVNTQLALKQLAEKENNIISLPYKFGSIFKINNIVILSSLIDPKAQIVLPDGAHPLQEIVITPFPNETVEIKGNSIYGTNLSQRRSVVAVYIAK